jgi:hypothetical protein
LHSPPLARASDKWIGDMATVAIMLAGSGAALAD